MLVRVSGHSKPTVNAAHPKRIYITQHSTHIRFVVYSSSVNDDRDDDQATSARTGRGEDEEKGERTENKQKGRKRKLQTRCPASLLL